MRKLLLAIAAVAAMAFAAPAFADHYGDAVLAVEDPTAGVVGDGAFTGTYVVSEDDPTTTDQNEFQEGTQTGYVGVYNGPNGTGIVACNGDPETLGDNPQDGDPLVGYIWVGPSMAASNVTQASPGNEIGAGNNHDADGETEGQQPTGHSPCPEDNPDNSVQDQLP